MTTDAMEIENSGPFKDRRSNKQKAFGFSLWGISIAYGFASFQKYGASSLGLGLAILSLSVIYLSQVISLLTKVFGRRKGEGNEH